MSERVGRAVPSTGQPAVPSTGQPAVHPAPTQPLPTGERVVLDLPDAEVVYFPQLFTPAQSDAYFAELLDGIGWRRERVSVYGRTFDIPRLTAWYGDPGCCYSYSGVHLTPQPWTATLLQIKQAVEAVSGTAFNSVLLNLYRHERDSVSWHADAEPELGSNPVIASVSLGATRVFEMKHRQSARQPRQAGSTWNHADCPGSGSTWNHPACPDEVKRATAPNCPIRRVRLHLTHGSFLLMRGPTQIYWLHQVPKQTQPVGPRINLTFRRIILSGAGE
jgi:alkylated DNA repair dioxygenase AlkB